MPCDFSKNARHSKDYFAGNKIDIKYIIRIGYIIISICQ